MDGIQLAWTPAFAAILSRSDFGSWVGSSATPTATWLRAIAFFNLGCHGLTVFGMAVRVPAQHGHGEDAQTVPPDSHFEKGDGPATWLGRTTKTALNRARQNCGSAPAPAASGRVVDHDLELPSCGNGSTRQCALSAASAVRAPIALAALRMIKAPRCFSAPGKALAWLTETLLSRTGARWLTTIGAIAGRLPVGLAAGPKVIGNCAIGTSVVGGDAREHLDGDLDNSRLS